jgi:hypothetical protein
VRDLERLDLERQGHVGAARTLTEEETLDAVREPAGRSGEGLVAQRLVGLRSEARMDARRETVCDRMSDHGVAVHEETEGGAGRPAMISQATPRSGLF